MQAERMQLHPQGQAACDACSEIAEHVFARRLVVHRDDVAEAFGQHRPQGSVAACRPQHERMVETGNDLLVDNAFQDTEVHHHPTLGVRVVVRRAPFHGHEQPVGMPVDLTARPVVSVEGMRGLERKLLCQSDHCHIRKDIH